MNQKIRKSVFSIERDRTLVLMFLAIVGIWFGFAWYLKRNYFDASAETAGQLGDTFGVINSLFSALAFAGLFYTIRLQKKELHETKLEFRLQNQTLQRQNFENTFFNLIQSRKDVIYYLESAKYDASYQSGEDHLDQIAHNLKAYLPDALNLHGKQITQTELEQFNSLIPSKSIDPYIRSLNKVLQYVQENTANEKDRLFYNSIISSKLLTDEAILLSYYVLLGGADLETRGRIDYMLKSNT